MAYCSLLKTWKSTSRSSQGKPIQSPNSVAIRCSPAASSLQAGAAYKLSALVKRHMPAASLAQPRSLPSLNRSSGMALTTFFGTSHGRSSRPPSSCSSPSSCTVPAGVHDAVVGSIAGVVGMVPEGLVLLTSTVMAIAVVRLARYGALVQELAAVELLARVDVLCADKTGTLTEGGTTLEEIVPASATDKDACAPLPADVRKVLGAFANDEANSTASLIALRGSCARPSGPEWNVVASVPFSSTRKWSALSFAMVALGSWEHQRLSSRTLIRLRSCWRLWTSLQKRANEC